MDNYTAYGSQSVETIPTPYASDETRQRDAEQQNAQLLYQAMRHKSMARAGASWFYWIAGLSLINSILFFTGSNIDFLAGLGITRLISWYLSDTQTGMMIGLGLSVVIAAGFAAIGYFGYKTEYRWAYIAGMVFYGLDGAILLSLGSWLNLIFHGYVLYRLFAGLQANIAASKVEQQLGSFAPGQLVSK